MTEQTPERDPFASTVRAYPAPAPEPADPHLGDVEDFDAYWREHMARGHRVRFMGEVVELPASLPLRFQTEATRLQDSESLEDIAHLVSILLPNQGDVLDRWLAAGIDVERLGVFLIYATQRVAGKPVTIAEAVAEYREQLARKQALQHAQSPAGGPVPNR